MKPSPMFQQYCPGKRFEENKCLAIGHSVPAVVAGFQVMDHKKSLTMATPRRIHLVTGQDEESTPWF